MRTLSNPPLPTFATAPVMGMTFGLLIVGSAIVISAHNVEVCFSIAGLVIVVGGVISVAFMSFQPDDVRAALDAIAAMFRMRQPPHDTLHQDMQNIVRLARLIGPRGLHALGAGLDETSIDDPFIRYGINMALGEYAAEDVRAMMVTAADAAYERDCVSVDVLRAMTSHAPAFGMVGTLVGMVAMLGSLNDNIATIGSTLAVAFLSTLYGVISARMVYMPAASRLQQEVDERHFRYQLITEGVVMLVSNETPSHIRDRLNGFLRPETRDYFDAIAKPAVTVARLPNADSERGEKSGVAPTAFRRLAGVAK